MIDRMIFGLALLIPCLSMLVLLGWVLGIVVKLPDLELHYGDTVIHCHDPLNLKAWEREYVCAYTHTP